MVGGGGSLAIGAPTSIAAGLKPSGEIASWEAGPASHSTILIDAADAMRQKSQDFNLRDYTARAVVANDLLLLFEHRIQRPKCCHVSRGSPTQRLFERAPVRALCVVLEAVHFSVRSASAVCRARKPYGELLRSSGRGRVGVTPSNMAFERRLLAPLAPSE